MTKENKNKLVVFGILLFVLVSNVVADEVIQEIKNKIAMAACNILNILIKIVGVIAVLFIVLSGIKYMTSADDPSARNEAKSRFIWAVIGLFIVLISCPLVDFLSIDPLIPGFCGRCSQYGIVITPPPGMVYDDHGNPSAPKVTLLAEPLKAKPGDTIKFTCVAEDSDGLSTGTINLAGTPAVYPFSPGGATSFTGEAEYSYPGAGQYYVYCMFTDRGGNTGKAIQYIVVSNSTNPAAVIDSIGGKSLAELERDNTVKRSLRMEIYVKGHMEGGTGDPECKWTIGGETLDACEGWIKVDPIGTKTAVFKIKVGKPEENMKAKDIYVKEYIGKLECSTKEDCKAKDTDGGNNPKKKGTCSKMRCHHRGYCEEEASQEDRCQNSIILIERYPDPDEKYKCTKGPINCYDYCGGRGGKCIQHGPGEDTCKCLEKNCMMRPASTTIKDLHLNDGNCYLVVDEMGVGARVKIKELYYKTGGTKCCEPPWAAGCDANGKVIQADLGGDWTSKEFECKDGWEGKCKVTIETYRADHNDYYSVCVEEA